MRDIKNRITLVNKEINAINDSIENYKTKLMHKKYELLTLNEELIKETCIKSGLKFPDAFLTTSPTALEYLNKYLELYNAYSKGYNYIYFRSDCLQSKVAKFIQQHKQDIVDKNLIISINSHSTGYTPVYINYEKNIRGTSIKVSYLPHNLSTYFFTVDKVLNYIFEVCID